MIHTWNGAEFPQSDIALIAIGHRDNFQRQHVSASLQQIGTTGRHVINDTRTVHLAQTNTHTVTTQLSSCSEESTLGVFPRDRNPYSLLQSYQCLDL